MRKLIVYATPIVLLLISVLIMHSGIFLKKPMHGNDDFQHYLNKVQTNVLEEQWNEAGINLQKLKNAWRQIINRIQFSVEKDEISRLSANLARMGGAMEAKDKGGVLIEVGEAREFWDELGK